MQSTNGWNPSPGSTTTPVTITHIRLGFARGVSNLKHGSPSWKAWLRRQHDPGPADLTASATSLPPLEFKALRLLPFGWGEGWQLRPSPPRRHWMDELPQSYKCLPLVMANQWGWQILCPTDVVVTWDGSAVADGPSD